MAEIAAANKSNCFGFTNYVFPIQSKEGDKEGHCKFLSSIFKIERNYSGKELQIISDMIREGSIRWGKPDESTQDGRTSLDEAQFYGSNGKLYSYGKSIFRRIEKILANDIPNDVITCLANEKKEDINMLF